MFSFFLLGSEFIWLSDEMSPKNSMHARRHTQFWYNFKRFPITPRLRTTVLHCAISIKVIEWKTRKFWDRTIRNLKMRIKTKFPSSLPNILSSPGMYYLSEGLAYPEIKCVKKLPWGVICRNGNVLMENKNLRSYWTERRRSRVKWKGIKIMAN